MKTIHFIASDLAKLTGHNTYEPIQNTIDKILVRNNLSSKYIPKSNLEQQLLELPSDEILKYFKNHLQKIQKTIKKEVVMKI